MCSAIAGFCARAPLQSPQRWLCTRTAFASKPFLRSKSSSSSSSAFFQASISSLSVRPNHFGVALVSPLPHSVRSPLVGAAVPLRGARTPSKSLLQTTGRARTSREPSFSSPFSCVGVSSSPLTPTAVSSSRRLLASKTAPPSPASPSPATPESPSHQLSDRAGEQQVLSEDKESHGDGLQNFYHMPSDHHGDPRHHINPDGTLRFQTTAESFHWENDGANTPAQQIVSVNGKKMIRGVATRDFVELFQIYQKNLPFWPRTRMSTWGNHDLLMKAEFLFFWVPTFIIWSLAVPMFTMLYMSDEAIYSAMTVKVIGRQWYWIYEIESPVEEEEE